MSAGTIDGIDGARLHERGFYAGDPYPVLARLREEAPVFWYEPGQFWAITRHEDAQRVHGDPETFSCRYGIAMLRGNPNSPFARFALLSNAIRRMVAKLGNPLTGHLLVSADQRGDLRWRVISTG